MGVLEKTQLKKTAQAQPFLKWVGGKGRLLSQLEELYPQEFNNFYEPFVGGGAVFFSLNPHTALINDTNAVLINAYRHIRDDVEGVVNGLMIIENEFHSLSDQTEKAEYYYAKRARFNELPADEFEKTLLLIFLNKTCFNGIYRENSKGGFNVPFGKYVKPTICNEDNLRAVAKALEHTDILSGSFEESIKSASKDDFVYFDPPYHPLNETSSFTSYHSSGFTSKNQEKLRDTFKELSDRGCKVMLSNSDTELIRDLYKDFHIHTVYAGRSVNSVGTKRGKISELVITNY